MLVRCRRDYSNALFFILLIWWQVPNWISVSCSRFAVVMEIVISSVVYFGFYNIPVAALACAWGFSLKFMVFIQLLIVQIRIIMECDYTCTQ